MDDFEKELKVGFLQEAEQSLADVEQCFLALESDPTNAENLNRIFRLAHNLKGSSKAVGFDEMGALTHEFETFILKIKNGELAPNADIVSFLLRCNDFLRAMVEGLSAELEARFEIAPWIEEMQVLASGGTSPAEETAHDEEQAPGEEASVDVAFAEPVVAAPEVAATTSELEPNLELLAELGALMDAPAPAMPAPTSPAKAPLAAVPASVPSPATDTGGAQHPAGASAHPGAPAKGAPATEESLRVSLSKVEALLNAVGEMVIMQSVLREQAGPSESALLRKTVHHLSKIGKEIQDLSMSLRMVPIKPTFQKMQRIVRDTSKALDKDVAINLLGEEAEIDKTVLEKINDPLVHLVRNSVDHGIENAETRRARGKAERGEVKLAAFHEGGRFVIEVRDDGGGLDPEKLLRKAIEKGLVKAGTKMSDADAYQLIFLPGFSTKEQVTDVSGRGVGMDVVKTNILALGGEIQIVSEMNKGTTFRILLPLTLAIIDGMIVTVGDQRFVVPMGHIHETLKPEASQVQQTTNMGDVLLLRGENLALFRLADFFGLKSDKQPTELIAFVVRSGGKQPFAILVDDILGQSQVVVKRLGPEFQQYRGVGGSTILGDGKPAFIIEPPDLFHRSNRTAAPKAAPKKGVAA